MSLAIIGAIGIVVCFALMFFLRMPCAIAFGLVGFIGVWYLQGFGPAASALATIPYRTMMNYVWTVVPLFVLMGYIASPTGLVEEFYDGIRRWIGHFRGGLAMSIIGANTGFGAVSGDSISAAITFTAISLPEMRKYGYADTLTLGSIVAGSFLAQFIPPSLTFIVYGALTQTSIGKLFIAGILPGLLLTALYCITIYFLCRRNPSLGPPGPHTTWREKLGAGRGMWAITIVFLVIIGGIYLGVFTPTEAGAAGVFVVLVLGLARTGAKRLSWQGLKVALKDAGLATGMVALLLIGCLVFNLFMTLTRLPLSIAQLITGISQSPIVALWIIVGIYIVLGCVIDALAMILLTIPIFFPIIVNLGVDPVQFGVLIVAMVSIAGVTPPFGINTYAVAAAAKDVPLFTVFRGSYPFLIPMFALVIFIVFFPQLSLFLVNMMPQG